MRRRYACKATSGSQASLPRTPVSAQRYREHVLKLHVGSPLPFDSGGTLGLSWCKCKIALSLLVLHPHAGLLIPARDHRTISAVKTPRRAPLSRICLRTALLCAAHCADFPSAKGSPSAKAAWSASESEALPGRTCTIYVG